MITTQIGLRPIIIHPVQLVTHDFSVVPDHRIGSRDSVAISQVMSKPITFLIATVGAQSWAGGTCPSLKKGENT